MKKIWILVLLVLLATTVSGFNYIQLDYLDFGDVQSELGHGLSSWGDPYSGFFCGSDNETLRAAIGKYYSCITDDKVAYFEMYTNMSAKQLQLRHLQRSIYDIYDLYVWNGHSWTKISKASSSDETCGSCTSHHCWFTDNYNLNMYTGVIKFKIVSTWTPTPLACRDYGVNPFSWARLNGPESDPLPEFGTIAALLALVGASLSFLVLRKK
ncbi:MAG: hypothetical protein V1837_04640 [Candidatus Woesearchaeota archaeon]